METNRSASEDLDDATDVEHAASVDLGEQYIYSVDWKERNIEE